MRRTECIVLMVAAIGLASPAWAADAAAGKAKAASCGGCHGANGEGRGAAGPPIAGWPEDKFVAALQDYKSGKKANAAMKGIAAGLKDADMENLAAHYASLKK
jgi:cytochrome c553